MSGKWLKKEMNTSNLKRVHIHLALGEMNRMGNKVLKSMSTINHPLGEIERKRKKKPKRG